MSETSRVAVLIPVFQAQDELEQTLKSLRNSSIPATVFVVDDGSSPPIAIPADDTLPVVRLLRLPRNQGIVGALNAGIEAARQEGFEFIARLDAGDFATPNRLALQISWLEAHPRCMLVGSDAEVRDEEGAYCFTIQPPRNPVMLAQALHERAWLLHPSVMFRASVFDELGLYSNTYEAAEDYELFLRIARRHEIGVIPEPLLIYVLRSGSISARKSRIQMISRLRIQRNYFDWWNWHHYYGMLRTCGSLLMPRWVKHPLKTRFLYSRLPGVTSSNGKYTEMKTGRDDMGKVETRSEAPALMANYFGETAPGADRGDRMKVLFVITESEKGGAQVHVLDLVSGCREYCEVALATGDTGYLTRESEAAGIPTYVVPGLVRSPSFRRDFQALRELMALIRQLRPDVVHAHTYKAGLLARVASFLCGVPAVYTAHTWCFQPGTGAWWKRVGLVGEWLTSRLSYRIITVSEANKAMAVSFRVASGKRIETVHNGVRDLDLRARPETNPCTIIMVARFVIQKDQTSLVNALAQVKGDWRLRFVGDGPTREDVRELVRKHGLEDRVEFLGERNDVPELLAGACVFALVTHMEGLPLGILEGMRAGLPVIASDVGGVRESIDDGRTGFVIPHGDNETLLKRLEVLIGDAEVRRQMGAAGRQKFENQFGYGAMLEKTMNIYRAACRDRAPSQRPPTRLVPVATSEASERRG